MFKKTKLAAAMTAGMIGALGIVSSAQAVHVSEDGTGQVLIFPYYNVNNNFVTNFAITNTTNLYKAVKIRFRESKASNDVLDFNVYMSPNDVWTASIRKNPANGKANIITTDNSCTFPSNDQLKGNGQDFVDGYTAVDTADVTEGYIEVIEMGVIADGPGPANDGGEYAETAEQAADGTVNTNPAVGPVERAVVNGILHGTDGVPADCSVIQDAWLNGRFGFTSGDMTDGVAVDADASDPYDGGGLNNGLVAPTGGLSGYGILLNTATGAAFVEQPVAIDGYATVPQHYRSNDAVHFLLPSLASGDMANSHITDANGVGRTTVNWPKTYFDTGAVTDQSPNPSLAAGANPLPMAHVLTSAAVGGPYFIDGGINGSTDWVLNFPMRKHGVYNGATMTRQADNTKAACVRDTVVVSNNTATDTVDRHPGDGAGNDCTNWAFKANAINDVVVNIAYFDNEEANQTVSATDGFSPVFPGAPDKIILDREVNVISFLSGSSNPSSVLGSPNQKKLSVTGGFTSGWAHLAFGDSSVSYNYATSSSIEALVDPVDASGNAATIAEGGYTNAVAGGGVDVMTAAHSYSGVPNVGFAALEAEIGPASVGETIDLVRFTDRP